MEADEHTGVRSGPYEAHTLSALAAMDLRVKYLVESILVEGQPCIVAGGEKTLKTSNALDLGMSLATGTPFLGRFAVESTRRVLMFSGESGLATLKQTCERIATSKGLAFDALGGFVLSGTLPALSDASALERLRATVRVHSADVLILDPAYLCMATDGRESSMFRMGEILGSINRLCLDLKLTFVLVHHSKTPEDRFPVPQLRDIAWAGFKEFARQWLLIGRRCRYQIGTGKHHLWLHAGGSAGHSSLWSLDVDEGSPPDRWGVQLNQVSAADSDTRKNSRKQSARGATAATRIIEALEQFEQGATERQIREAAKLSGSSFKAAIQHLSESGCVAQCSVTREGREYSGWELNDAA